VKMTLLVVALLCLVSTPALATGISVAGADVGPAYWQPISGDEAVLAPLQLTLKPFNQEGPDTPTSLDEIVPWALANFGVDIPFQGDSETFLRPLGLGVSESVKVGSVAKVDIRAGVGWLTGSGACVFLKSPLFAI